MAVLRFFQVLRWGQTTGLRDGPLKPMFFVKCWLPLVTHLSHPIQNMIVMLHNSSHFSWLHLVFSLGDSFCIGPMSAWCPWKRGHIEMHEVEEAPMNNKMWEPNTPPMMLTKMVLSLDLLDVFHWNQLATKQRNQKMCDPVGQAEIQLPHCKLFSCKLEKRMHWTGQTVLQMFWCPLNINPKPKSVSVNCKWIRCKRIGTFMHMHFQQNAKCCGMWRISNNNSNNCKWWVQLPCQFSQGLSWDHGQHRTASAFKPCSFVWRLGFQSRLLDVKSFTPNFSTTDTGIFNVDCECIQKKGAHCFTLF